MCLAFLGHVAKQRTWCIVPYMAIFTKYGNKIIPNAHWESNFFNGYFSPIVVEMLIYNPDIQLTILLWEFMFYDVTTKQTCKSRFIWKCICLQKVRFDGDKNLDLKL